MIDTIKKNWIRNKYFILPWFFIILLLLLGILSSKNDQKIEKKITENFNGISEGKIFKDFLLNQIKAPFINLDYKIVKGDTIEKILLSINFLNIFKSSLLFEL